MKGQNLGFRFVGRVRARLLKNNKNWLGVVCGETGSGKSYSAIAIGLLISKNVHFVFSGVELLELINKPERLRKGDIVIFDEAGVGMSSREWYSVQNKVLGSVLQTFRNLNIGLIFTVPHLSFIDIQARKLFHTYFQTHSINYDEEKAILKIYDIKPNPTSDKIYYAKPKFKNSDGKTETMKYMVVKKADEEILEAYEVRKKEYTVRLNARALETVREAINPTKKKEFDIRDLVPEVMKNKEHFINTQGGRSKGDFDRSALRTEFNLSVRQADGLKYLLEKGSPTSPSK